MDKFAGGVSLIPEQDWETAEPAAVSVRDTAGHRLDRLRQRRAGRLGRPAQLVGRVVRPALRRHRRRPPRRPAAKHLPALRRAHAGDDAADGHEPGRPERGERLAGHRHRHDGARKHGLRHGDEHGRELGDDERLDDGRRGRRVQPRRRGDRRDERPQRRRRQRERRHGARRSAPSSSTSCPARCCSTSPIRATTTTGPATTPTRRPATSTPGAFDIQEFQVFDDGTNVIFRVKVRDLSPTFGSPLGAQLVDVYVHDPGAAPGSTSTAAANASRNFQIAPAYAWSRLIQVQGFGQRYEDAAGTPLGTVAISANQISRFITFRVPKASLGSPGPGWAFTVVLTGQDGFSGDQARGFQSTPQDFQFGVCAVAERRSALHRQPGHRAEGGRRDPAGGRPPVRRARLHAAQPGRAAGRRDSLGAAARSSSSISIFLICSIAAMTRCAFSRSGSASSSVSARRDDLPRDAEPVLQPAARALLAALGERAPVRVDLFLALAADLERDRLAERELRARRSARRTSGRPARSSTVITVPSARGPASP